MFINLFDFVHFCEPLVTVPLFLLLQLNATNSGVHRLRLKVPVPCFQFESNGVEEHVT
jgi:hypothetical protein